MTIKEVVIKGDPFRDSKEVDFFLRIHGHLPDGNCGGRWPFAGCQYTPDDRPINEANADIQKLRTDATFQKKEAAVLRLQAKWQSENLLRRV